NAYLLPLLSGESPEAHLDAANALSKLAAVETDTTTGAALQVAIALRKARSGDTLAPREILTELHKDAPQHLVTTVALQLLLKDAGDVETAANALAECAAGQSNDMLAAALALEAGLMQWQAGNRKAA